MHTKISALADASPLLFLLFSPEAADLGKQLPFSVYESALTESTEQDEGKFVPLDVGIEAGEAERIAVDDVANENAGDGDPTGGECICLAQELMPRSEIASLTRQRNAIAMLYDRVRVIQAYVSGVIAGKLKSRNWADRRGASPVDYDTLRQCAALAATLPIMDGSDFQRELRTEYNDTQLMSYLTTLLGQLDGLASVSDKHWALHPPQSEDMGMKHGVNPKLGSQYLGPNRRRGAVRR